MLSDMLYSYETYKCVRIKDRTLGLIYWSLFILTVMYIFGFVIVVWKGYLAYDNPVGIVRAKLIKPSGLVIRADDTHGYCAESQCRIWDHYDIVYPKSESDTLSITTHVVEIDQERLCKETDSICSTDVFQEIGKNKFFIADVENFQLVVEHSMQAEKLIYEDDDDESGFAESSRHMNGVLFSKNETVLKRFPRNRSDQLLLRQLLDAADVDLDAKSFDASLTKKTRGVEETMRARGMVLFVVITYTNTNNFFGTHAVQYEYRVHRLHETNFVVYETLGSGEGDATRHLHKRNGIHLKFIITGNIGRFSFQALLTNIISALGLVTLSSIVVDQLALYVLPRKRQYENFKYTDATPESEKSKPENSEKSNKSKSKKSEKLQDASNKNKQKDNKKAK